MDSRPTEKPLEWLGSSYEDLLALPRDAVQALGFQLGRVQRGRSPESFSPMGTVGAGVIEVRVRENSQIYRVFYLARFNDQIYILHVFEKKTQKTAPKDLEAGRARYKEAVALEQAKQHRREG